MSEYQYIAFRAVDRPLTDKELAFAQTQSSRAEISCWSFENEYHYGHFRGDPDKLLRNGFDVHLHYASLHNLDRLARQRRLAVSKGWRAAKSQIEGRILNVLASIRVQAEDAIADLNSSQPSTHLSIADVAADLAALETDFPAADVGRRGRTVSVTTKLAVLYLVYACNSYITDQISCSACS